MALVVIGLAVGTQRSNFNGPAPCPPMPRSTNSQMSSAAYPAGTGSGSPARTEMRAEDLLADEIDGAVGVEVGSQLPGLDAGVDDVAQEPDHVEADQHERTAHHRRTRCSRGRLGRHGEAEERRALVDAFEQAQHELAQALRCGGSPRRCLRRCPSSARTWTRGSPGAGRRGWRSRRRRWSAATPASAAISSMGTSVVPRSPNSRRAVSMICSRRKSRMTFFKRIGGAAHHGRPEDPVVSRRRGSTAKRRPGGVSPR